VWYGENCVQFWWPKLDFKSWRIGLVFGTFVFGNGEGLWKMSGSKHSPTSFIPSNICYIFKKNLNINKKKVDIDLSCFA
jgi:hypothetical protein